VIEELDQDAIRILEIEGARAVAVRFDRLDQGKAMGLNTLGNLIDVLRPSHNETQMIQLLNRAKLGTLWKFMNREIITA
jgi:hypothetical protein